MNKLNFKTVMFGYKKKAVDDTFDKMQADMDMLVEESKNKVKQAQAIATQANAKVEELQKELSKIQKELEALKK